MDRIGVPAIFLVSASPEQVRKEKEKARELRRSQWWKRQTAKGCCYYCQARVEPAELTMDHIVPLVRGGKSTRGNTVPACKSCNDRKKYLLPTEWDEYVRRLSGTGPSGICEPDAEKTEGK
ncbi:MAG: HNH endonuclease [Desulfobacteraceae bacterium]|nr:HNH endonuclease [Desulfobacteraceae bacterium]